MKGKKIAAWLITTVMLLVSMSAVVAAAAAYPEYGSYTNNGTIAYGIGTYSGCPIPVSFYDTGLSGFQVKSVGPEVALTAECGFFTVVRWTNGADKGTTYMDPFKFGEAKSCTRDGDITVTVTPEYDESGKAVIFTYTLATTRDTDVDVYLSSYGFSDKNDTSLRTTLTKTGIRIYRANAEFVAEPVGTAFDTRWYGRSGGSYYYDLEKAVRENPLPDEYTGNSSLGWQWHLTLPAKGSVTRQVKLFEAPAYKVTFDANGGEGQMDDLRIVRGIDTELTENAFTRDGGYKFLGWSEDKDATSATYQDKEAITISADTTLYAVWQDPDQASFVAPSALELVYTGEAQDLVKTGTATGGTMMYSLTENGTFSETIPQGTEAGEYTVYFMAKGDATHRDSDVGSIKVTIDKADSEFSVKPQINDKATITTSGEIAFTGEAVDLLKAGETTCGKILYSLDGETYSETIPQVDAVGEFAVYFKIQGDANHKDSDPETIKIVVMDYEVVEGANAEWSADKTEGIKIRVKRSIADDTTSKHFTGIETDGKATDKANYTTEDGSIIITIKPEYLKTLGEGKHTVKVIFDDPYSVETSFSIGVTAPKTDESDNAPKTDGKVTSPQTGEETSPVFLLAAFVTMAAGTVFALKSVKSKKKEN